MLGLVERDVGLAEQVSRFGHGRIETGQTQADREIKLGFRSFFHCIKSFDSLIQSLSFEPTVLTEHLKDRL
jgi:hypothetical protein